MHKQKSLVLVVFLLLAANARAANIEPQQAQKQDLQIIQEEIRKLETGIHSGKQAEASLASELQKLERLLKLQALEIQLSTLELEKMEDRAQEMQVRRDSLEESIQLRKRRLRRLLSVLPTLEGKNPLAKLAGNNSSLFLSQYKESIVKLLKYDKVEIQALRMHLDEADTLNNELQEEKERILAHTDDLKEKQAILLLNKDLKGDLLKKTHAEQEERLRVYRAAKAAESELESMMSKLNLAAEIRQKQEPHTSIALNRDRGLGFLAHKGKLHQPVEGAILTAFGRKYDQATSLYTFHKGITIQTGSAAEIRAIFPGKVVFSGKLGGYGQLVIIDHGEQYYSLQGQLGEVYKKEGDTVAEGEIIGKTALDNTPLYFEIRQRHVAVNPVPWLAKAH